MGGIDRQAVGHDNGTSVRVTERRMIGREPELEATRAFLDAIAHGPVALSFDGEPGIGKTTVWQTAVAMATDSGCGILVCRPAAAEATLTFAGLTDLLSGVDRATLDELPPPQRDALTVALLEADDPSASPEPRAVFAGLASVLGALAVDRPAVVAIDDIHWLDRSSQAALEFAVRRLGGTRIGLLVTARIGDGATITPGLARALEDAGMRHAELGPLGVASLQDLIRTRVGQDLSRSTLVRIATATRGNPFFALEVAREVIRRGDSVPGQSLPLPDDYAQLIAARIRRLPSRTRRALEVAAALSNPTSREVRIDAIARAERVGFVSIERGRIKFTHPLYQAAVYASMTGVARRHLHRQLAALATDAEERARHSALGTESPSAAVASALEEAAEHARIRGAPAAAAELMELSIDCMPAGDPEERARRTLAAAEHALHAGDLAHARDLAEAALGAPAVGATRGRALMLLGEIRYHAESFGEAIPLFEAALEDLADDPAAVDIHVNLAYAYVNLGEEAATGPHARAAVKLARRLGNAGVLAVALAVSAIVEAYRGRPLNLARVERAMRLEDAGRRTVMPMRPTLIAAILLNWGDELERSAQLFAGLRQRTIDRGEEGDLPLLSAQYSMVERRLGRLPAALAIAQEGLDIARTLGSRSARMLMLAERCYVHGTMGSVALARADANEAKEMLATNEFGFSSIWACAAIAFLELSVGNAAAARDALEPVTTRLVERRVCDPVSAMFVPDAIEALIATGEVDRAALLTDLLTAHGQAMSRRSVVAVAARCRALELTVRGRTDEAFEAIAAAMELELPSLPLSLGRTLLAKGRIERRARRKREARTSFDEAASMFELIGARLWAVRAQEERDRTGLRHAATGGLTPTEHRVAELAAMGLTTRRIADEVFISPKTVEAELARIYAKLGISTRAELGRAFAKLEWGANK